jgi:cytoplasmic FMR1 interacting protein
VYSFFKVQAASSYLENNLKCTLELKTTGRLNAGKTRYPVLLQLRHLQLLGRFVDLNALIAQRINSQLRKNINNAISRFESQDLAHIIVCTLHCLEAILVM